jgi:hypothetical protein
VVAAFVLAIAPISGHSCSGACIVLRNLAAAPADAEVEWPISNSTGFAPDKHMQKGLRVEEVFVALSQLVSRPQKLPLESRQNCEGGIG